MRTHLRIVAVLLPLVVTALPSPALAQWGYPAESNLRINVKPREASVYVDGYFAGKVDDFDGVLQRLHVTPGRHELIIYLDGYRSLKEGELVEFELEPGPKGLKAVNVRAVNAQQPAAIV